jgi:hypothetical protein
MANHTLTLAVGDEYPAAHRLSIDELVTALSVTCGVLSGSLEITALEPTAPLRARVVESTGVVIEGVAPGDAHVRVHGRYVPTDEDGANCEGQFTAGTAVDVVVIVRVEGRQAMGIGFRPASTSLISCREARLDMAIAGTDLNRLIGDGPILVDAEGDPFRPDNTTAARPMSMGVSAPPGAALAVEADGVAALSLGDAEGTVVIEPVVGPPVEIEVVAASRITEMPLRFDLAGSGGGGIPDLQSGAVYGEGGFGRTANIVAPIMTGLLGVDGDEVCVSAPPSWFVLETATPDTCAIVTSDFNTTEIYGDPIGSAGRVIADGLCELTVSASRFNGGDGLSAQLSVTFLNTDQLHGQ